MFYLGHEQLRNASVGHQVVVGGDEGRHAVAVKRLRTGETVSIGDGHGLVLDCTVEHLVAKESFTARVRAVYQIADQMTRIIVIQALIKGERMERALETLTEAGVDQISVWGAEHSIARIRADQTVKTQVKFDRRVFEASKQARRASRPKVTLLADRADVIRAIREADLAILLDELSAAALPEVLPSRRQQSECEDPPVNESILLIAGPEGGFGDAERAQFLEAGAIGARMGGDVLRASTAATVALGWVMGASGRWSVSD